MLLGERWWRFKSDVFWILQVDMNMAGGEGDCSAMESASTQVIITRAQALKGCLCYVYLFGNNIKQVIQTNDKKKEASMEEESGESESEEG